MAKLEINTKRPIFGKDEKLIGILEVKVWKVPENKCFPEGYKYSFSDTTTTDAKDTINT